MKMPTLPHMAKGAKIKLEQAFLLSPVFVLLTLIFNVPNTKSIMSRLIVVVCLYCLVFYRSAIKDNLQNKHLKQYVVVSAVASFYFAVLHLTRGDEFTFARTLLTSIAYLLFVPWSKVSKNWFYAIIIFAGFSAGVNAYYEHEILGIKRVGIASNPIPYAYFCATLMLSTLYSAFYPNSHCPQLKLLGVFSSLSACYALLLTDVRGIWITIPLIIFLVLKRAMTAKISTKKFALIFTLIAIGAIVLLKPALEPRWDRTMAEFQAIQKGIIHSSIGTRLTFWKHGLEYIKSSPIIGIGDDALVENNNKIGGSVAQNGAHLHNQFIDEFARSGIIGLSLILLWVIALNGVVINGKVIWNNNPFLLSATALFCIASLTDVPLIHAHIVYLIPILGGLILIFENESETKANQ